MTDKHPSLPITFLATELLIRACQRALGATATRAEVTAEVADLTGYADFDALSEQHHPAICALRLRRVGCIEFYEEPTVSPEAQKAALSLLLARQANDTDAQPAGTAETPRFPRMNGFYLDEMDSISIPPQVQASSFQLLLDHKLGDALAGSGKVLLSRTQASTMARNMHRLQEARGRTLSHTQALAEIAVLTGHRNVHEMTASYQPEGKPIHAAEEHIAPDASTPAISPAAQVRAGTDGKTIWFSAPNGIEVETLRLLDGDFHRANAGALARYGHMDAVGETLDGAVNLIRLALGGVVPHAHFGIICDDPTATAQALRNAIADPTVAIVTYEDLGRDITLFQRLTRVAFEGSGLAADGVPPFVLVRGHRNDPATAGIFADSAVQAALGTRLIWLSLTREAGRMPNACAADGTPTGLRSLDALTTGAPQGFPDFGVRRRHSAEFRRLAAGLIQEFGSRPSAAERYHVTVHRDRRDPMDWVPPFILDSGLFPHTRDERPDARHLLYTAFTGKAIQSLRARLDRTGAETIHEIPTFEPRRNRPIPDDLIVMAAGNLPQDDARSNRPLQEVRGARGGNHGSSVVAASFTRKTAQSDAFSIAARSAVKQLLASRSRPSKRS